MAEPRDIKRVKARNPEIALLIGMLQAGTATARRELGEVADEALVWQPYPNGHSIGAILIHLAACEAAWLHYAAALHEVSLDMESELMGGPRLDQCAALWPPPPAKPLAWYYAQQDEVRARTIELISPLPDPAAVRAVPWSPGRECSVRWIIHYIIEHEAYHNGQAVLLSLMRSGLRTLERVSV